ncbi:MAG: NAD(P)/FAD-dependent oxidoreductase [Alphaproteobacteria bacterium]|nr:NAD(P)/FAD-dependent oxidoreductase [Alphaproteobacteria bacterium]
MAKVFDAIVLGAGAAGLMCAMTAGARGRRVLVLDHAEEAGKKILISGGGRCNFTNLEIRPERFLSANPHFARSALARYTASDFLALVAKHGIAWHEKTLGQLFCDGSAREIVAMLLAECAAAAVDIRLRHRITEVTRSADGFSIATDHGLFQANALVIATGGLSIPKMGATGLAYDITAQFGLKLTERRPGLVPLTFGGAELEMMRGLAGVAFPVVASGDRQRFAEAALFTHRGLSGPAILQISSYWREGRPIALDLLPGRQPDSELREAKRARPNAELRSILADMLPQRLARVLAERFGDGAIGQMPDRKLLEIAQFLGAWQLLPAGSEGYAKAEVTLGGVDTAGLSQKTLEAKNVPGLFVIGEAVDVTGWLGGYNFQWAWASGWCAGQAA